MSSYSKKDVQEEAYKVWERLEPVLKSKKGYKHTLKSCKTSCYAYCDLKKYSEKDRADFWDEVKEYLRIRF